MLNREFMCARRLPLLALCLALFAACSGDPKPEETPDSGQLADMSAPLDMPSVADMPADLGTPDMTPALDAAPDADTAMLVIPDGCNPVAHEHDCLFPYPSNVFLEEDASTPSGHRVVIGEAAKLLDRQKRQVDFLLDIPADGFSHHQPIVAHFAQQVSEDNLTFHTDDPTATLSPDSPTLLINAETGAFVPHWAEVDRIASKPSERVLLIRTFENLDFGKRYIVALQHLEAEGGGLIETPNGFKQIRDKVSGAHPDLDALSARYERDIFPLLDQLEVPRDTLQLAWDFTVQSEEMVTRDLLQMRDDLMARLNTTPPRVTLTAVKEEFNDQIALRLEGTLEVPLYLEEDVLFPVLHRDAEGKVAANGTHEVPFTLQVPRSAMPEAQGFEPARLMQYGHGFFGAREEINYGFMRNFSNEQRYVTASVDWRGMSEAELEGLTSALTGPEKSQSLRFLNGVHQGIINFIALSHALKTSLTELDELKRFDALLYEPEHLYYYGISQGQILGAAFLALSPHVERAVLSVGGAPFSFMMGRSNNFAAFVFLLKSALGSALDVQRFITLCQHSFDRIDPSTYSAHLTRDLFAGVPQDRKILMNMGFWDHSVPILSGLIYARNAGLDVLEPPPVVPYGFGTVASPTSGSALVLLDYMTMDPPGFYAQLPTMAQIEAVDEVNVHESIRKNEKIKMQIDRFLRPDGVIENFCDGPCDPE